MPHLPTVFEIRTLDTTTLMDIQRPAAHASTHDSTQPKKTHPLSLRTSFLRDETTQASETLRIQQTKGRRVCFSEPNFDFH